VAAPERAADGQGPAPGPQLLTQQPQPPPQRGRRGGAAGGEPNGRHAQLTPERSRALN
jgi:hypothetical protein